MLAENIFNQIPYDAVFACGIIENSEEGIYMTNSRQNSPLAWVAKKGTGDDWAIYTYWYNREDIREQIGFTMSSGEKVTNKTNILKLVPCTDEVFKKYRY